MEKVEKQTEWLTFRASRALVDAVDELANSDSRTRSWVLRAIVTEGVHAAAEEPEDKDEEAPSE